MSAELSKIEEKKEKNVNYVHKKIRLTIYYSCAYSMDSQLQGEELSKYHIKPKKHTCSYKPILQYFIGCLHYMNVS